VEIVVRRAEPDDYEGIWAVYRDPDAYFGTLQMPMPAKELWKKRASEASDSDYLFVACMGDEIVGHSGLHPAGKSPRRAHAMTLGLAVPGARQGQGVGRALMGAMVDLADRWLNVVRLELTVFSDNERAIALYRKFGFEVEGTHRAYALRDGQYVDTLAMARVRRGQKL
jgi:putative acetyltransferase